MSPTHHSSSSTTNITLSNLAMNSHILKPKSPKQTLDTSNFSCLNKPSSDSYAENTNIVHRNHENNNWVSTLKGSRVGSLEDEAIKPDDPQVEEDLHYLGEKGFSRWGGEVVEGGWVRKLGYAERFMTDSQDFGVMSTVYNLWFESKAKVEFNTIKEASYTVARYL